MEKYYNEQGQVAVLWKDFLFTGQYERIEDEYDRVTTPEEMVDWVENRSHPRGLLRSHSDPLHRSGAGNLGSISRGV